ncbi:hypothetical protein CR513_41244, partial [Mucuna pruriens]
MRVARLILGLYKGVTRGIEKTFVASTLTSKGKRCHKSHYEGDLLMVRRLMGTLVGEDAKSQIENIFHSTCLFLDEIVVDKQVSLAITLGSYRDDIVCDVVPMDATSILLGRP